VSFAVYILVLVASGVVIGVIVGLLVRRTSSEGMVPPIVLGVIATVVAGPVVTALFDAPKIVGLLVALTLAALYVSRSGLSNKSAGHWFGGAGGGGGWGDGGDGGHLSLRRVLLGVAAAALFGERQVVGLCFVHDQVAEVPGDEEHAHVSQKPYAPVLSSAVAAAAAAAAAAAGRTQARTPGRAGRRTSRADDRSATRAAHSGRDAGVQEQQWRYVRCRVGVGLMPCGPCVRRGVAGGGAWLFGAADATVGRLMTKREP
jgi:uncharacterized membrane protein YeaQ/YmgE (transglycosylase-associated protein family)